MASFATDTLTTSARNGSTVYLPDGKGSLSLSGTFSAGSPVVSLSVLLADGSTWAPSADTYSAGDVDAIDIKRAGYVRLSLAGGDGSSSITAEIHAG